MLNGVNDLLVVNITSSDNNNVLTSVVGGVVVSKVVNSKSMSEISVSLDWLSHHVLSERVEVSVLKSGFRESIVVILVFLANLLFKELKFSSVEGWVADHITKNLDSS